MRVQNQQQQKIQVPTESAQLLYDTLHDAGKTFELRDAGYYAIDSLRVEKAYRALKDIGADIAKPDGGLPAALC